MRKERESEKRKRLNLPQLPFGMGVNTILALLMGPIMVGEHPGRRDFFAASFVIIGCTLT